MSEQDDPFSPHRVDESIEWLSASDQPEVQASMEQNARLIRDIQQLCRVERKQYLRALQRVEERLIAQHVPAHIWSREAQTRAEQRESQRKTLQRSFKMKEKRLSSKIKRSVTLLAATLVTLMLVGSLVLVLNFAHGSAAVGSPGGTATPTQTAGITPTQPANGSFGHTVYVTPGVQDTSEGLAWSPDSQRVASVTSSSIQIWDATTGGHRVSVALTAADGQPLSVAWSPVPGSQMIAVGTTKVMLLINAATGAIVHTYTPALERVAAVGNGSPLAAHLPVSGFDNDPRAVAWSPDGRFLAVAVNHNTLQSEIHVFDVQNFSLVYTLHPPSQDYDVYALVWSPDGKYLAGGGFTVALVSSSTVIWSWDVSARQLVFRHGGGGSFGPGLAFQSGGGHNLSFIGPSKDIKPTALGLWDVATGQLIRAYQTVSSGQVAWSPDAGYLAYVEATSNLIGIIDVQSGQLVFTYRGHSAQVDVCQLAWSPNGKYIVSGECQGQTTVVRVWTAGFAKE